MATSYKTPGVFVEEITKFPPSVAQVETAIPAFIGYTEKATDKDGSPLSLKPKRIGSLVEFEYFYGGGSPLTVGEVNIDEANNFKSAKVASNYYMYDSLRMFYANGGGDCFIVSVGLYPTAVSDTALNLGTDALLKADDPTLLLYPDAVVLGDTVINNVQTHALAHCALDERMDRFCIFDVRENDTLGNAFRKGVGTTALSYGSCYTPWINTNLPKTVNYNDVKNVIKRNAALKKLKDLTDNTDIQTQITALENAYGDKKKVADATALLLSGFNSFGEKFQDVIDTFNGTKIVSDFQKVIKFLVDVFVKVDDYADGVHADHLTNTTFLDTLRDSTTFLIKPAFSLLYTDLIAVDKEAKLKITGYSEQAKQVDITNSLWGANFVSGVTASGILTSVKAVQADKDLENMAIAIANLTKQFDSISRAYVSIILSGINKFVKDADKSLELAFPLYKTILDGVRTCASSMPPSGAIAGIYAMTDRTRGVWKAPANVSLNNVIEPSVTFTKSELDNLNVDVTAGKSINAIRTFFGKGTLVYGARTLAGNDNEWRYIPVRRLFIMVEESVKKATEQFVFEPNDANTWVKVQAMIENFLYNIWRQGALQGIKPEHAFYVAVGLNKTMNPIDILEGRMIIEIGMAAVRPAEFIILRFSHKMAES